MHSVEQIPSFPNSTLLLAGDVSDDLQTLETTLRILTHKFTHVFFTVGNHELWLRGKEARERSTSIGAHTQPLSTHPTRKYSQQQINCMRWSSSAPCLASTPTRGRWVACGSSPC